MKRLFVLLIPALLLLVPAGAQAEDDSSQLTVDRIFNSREFSGAYAPRAMWMEDGSGYLRFEPADGGREIVRYNPADGSREVLVSAEMLTPEGWDKPLQLSGGSFSDDMQKFLIFTNTARVWRAHTRGDYWVLDRGTGTLRQLGREFEPSQLMFAKFSPAGDRVAYVMKNNIYVESLADGEITQLTHDGSRTIINGTFDWVYEEEFHMRDGFRWSPDGKHIAYWQLDAEGVRDFFLINNTEDIYSKVIPVQYPKAGETNSAAKIGVVSSGGGQTLWFDLEGDPRQHYIARMDWAANSSQVLFQRLNRHQNKLWLTLGNITDGSTTVIHTETEAAWVEVYGDVRWLEDDEHFLWESESSGWHHVYLLDRQGNSKNITPYPFDVISLEAVDEAGGYLYYIASPNDPTERYLFRSLLDGSGEPERLSPADAAGWHSYQLSPDAEWAFHSYSSFAKPTTTSLITLPDHAVKEVIVDGAKLAKKLETLARGEVEFFRVQLEDGLEADGYMMRPHDFDPVKKYPVLIHAYTEPWGQTVQNRWSSRNYLWHLMLTQRGYIVMSLDNRGTPAPRGREWRKSIYGKIGQLNSSDQAAGLRSALAKYDYLDAERIAMWGWSGGGSATLNALFRYPELYQVGMAVAPVSNLRYYDTIYQERYTGIPQEVPENYDLGSPINYAHQLEGDLLIVHGTGDDNVHYQNAEAVINKLIEHNKPFAMMAYPNRSHGIYEGKNTTLHLYTLLTSYLQEHLEAGGR